MLLEGARGARRRQPLFKSRLPERTDYRLSENRIGQQRPTKVLVSFENRIEFMVFSSQQGTVEKCQLRCLNK
jgi:phage baseplate assembly protein W